MTSDEKNFIRNIVAFVASMIIVSVFVTEMDKRQDPQNKEMRYTSEVRK